VISPLSVCVPARRERSSDSFSGANKERVNMHTHSNIEEAPFRHFIGTFPLLLLEMQDNKYTSTAFSYMFRLWMKDRIDTLIPYDFEKTVYIITAVRFKVKVNFLVWCRCLDICSKQTVFLWYNCLDICSKQTGLLWYHCLDICSKQTVSLVQLFRHL
jgi:hypothetical protein